MPERNGPYRGFLPAHPPRQIDDHDSISVGGASYYAGKSGRAKVKLPEVTKLSRLLTAKGGARSICVFRRRNCEKLDRRLAISSRSRPPGMDVNAMILLHRRHAIWQDHVWYVHLCMRW